MQNLMDSPLAHRSTAVRKAAAHLLQIPRTLDRLGAGPSRFQAEPPIVVNSIPKSGTHLLLNVARALPGGRYYGSFLAQTPSISLRMRSQKEIDFHIARIPPGEVVGAHLFHTPETSASLQKINAVNLMIIRDPADIFLSEIHYLTHMNRYHRMAREFRELDAEGRHEIALNGSRKRPDIFPDFAARLDPYVGWLDDPHACVVRYEDLDGGERQAAALARVYAAWAAAAGADPECPPDLAARLSVAIEQWASHTYSGRARKREGRDEVCALEPVARMRSRLGYGAEAQSSP